MNEIWELSKDLPRIPITEVKETTLLMLKQIQHLICHIEFLLSLPQMKIEQIKGHIMDIC